MLTPRQRAGGRYDLIGRQSLSAKPAVVVRKTRTPFKALASMVAPGSVVAVFGPTGGVGQLVTAKLLERGYKVRAASRNVEKAKEVLTGFGDNVEVVFADAREANTLPNVLQGVDAVCCCTGTTAFPSKRWDGDNGPKPTDYDGTRNIISSAKQAGSVKRFVLVTSAGVERRKEFPWLILNAFGVLYYKALSEEFLKESGMPWTLVRPSRLTDGPYTSYDLNTLLQATSDKRMDVQLSPRDDLLGEASRIATAEAVVQSLSSPLTENKAFAISSIEGEGPGSDPAKWQLAFERCFKGAPVTV